DAVYCENAVLVQADVDDVDVPGGERGDHRVVAGAVEEAEPLDAGELGARVVDAVQVDDGVARVEELIPGDVEAGAASRGRGRRRRWGWGWGWGRRAAARASDDLRRGRPRRSGPAPVRGGDDHAHPLARIA